MGIGARIGARLDGVCNHRCCGGHGPCAAGRRAGGSCRAAAVERRGVKSQEGSRQEAGEAQVCAADSRSAARFCSRTVAPTPAPETATGLVNGYMATQSATGTKTDTPLSETPQSVSVVTARSGSGSGRNHRPGSASVRALASLPMPMVPTAVVIIRACAAATRTFSSMVCVSRMPGASAKAGSTLICWSASRCSRGRRRCSTGRPPSLASSTPCKSARRRRPTAKSESSSAASSARVCRQT